MRTVKIMLLGDTHGNTKFVSNCVIPAAREAGARWIYQVGDFGYWEHTPEGVEYLNAVNEACIVEGVEIVFIQGNHDKVSLIPKKYNEVLGFFHVRSNIWFAPNGTVWAPDGKTNFIALGGAYSVDKMWRLDQEHMNAKNMATKSLGNYDYPRSERLAMAHEKTKGSLWFPEEQMSNEEFDRILKNVTDDIDVILAHDKPFASNPMIRLSPIPECEPNQRNLQKAVNVLKPKLLVHGHLHVRYVDTIRCGDDNTYTRVEGLGADVPNFNQHESSWEPTDAWEFLTLGE